MAVFLHCDTNYIGTYTHACFLSLIYVSEWVTATSRGVSWFHVVQGESTSKNASALRIWRLVKVK